jgi:hypothetical protein
MKSLVKVDLNLAEKALRNFNVKSEKALAEVSKAIDEYISDNIGKTTGLFLWKRKLTKQEILFCDVWHGVDCWTVNDNRTVNDMLCDKGYISKDTLNIVKSSSDSELARDIMNMLNIGDCIYAASDMAEFISKYTK